MIDQSSRPSPREMRLPQDEQGFPRRPPALPAKGTCWYCEHPVDNVRRFCSVACRDDYYEEEGESGGNGS